MSEEFAKHERETEFKRDYNVCYTCSLKTELQPRHQVTKKALPLTRPFIPPIFSTIAANFVYCDNSSCTSLTDTPLPRATRVHRPGWQENSSAPLGLSEALQINADLKMTKVFYHKAKSTIKRHRETSKILSTSVALARKLLVCFPISLDLAL